MSDTPRTDAQKRGDFVHISFARELERENAALRELASRMATEMRELDHEFTSLRDYDAARRGAAVSARCEQAERERDERRIVMADIVRALGDGCCGLAHCEVAPKVAQLRADLAEANRLLAIWAPESARSRAIDAAKKELQ